MDQFDQIVASIQGSMPPFPTKANQVPNMPAVTPGDGIGAGTVALFLALATRSAATEHVQMAAIAAACIIACVACHRHGKLREMRNGTEQTRIEAEHLTAAIAADGESE